MHDSERYSREGILAYAQHFPFFKLMGLEILDVSPGWSRTRVSFRKDLTQPAGIMHGGVIASLIDTGIAHALLMTDRLKQLQEEQGALVSVDLRVKFIRPVSEGPLVCESTVVRLGQKILHAEALVTNELGKEVARGDAIYMVVPGEQVSSS